jgi:diacylglycerol kinase (ATP)
VLVLVNPVSGGGGAARARPHVASLLRKQGVDATLADSRSTEDVRRIAAGAAAQGYDTLAVLGGDGTAHHAFNAAFSTGIACAFFPAGNGNDIARALGLPLDPIAAAHTFARGRTRTVDALRATTADGAAHLFFAAGGLGLDAATAALVNGRFRRLPGVARYVAAALWALRTFRPFELEVAFDDAQPAGPFDAPPASPSMPTQRFGPSLFAAVANGQWYGAGVCIAPHARMDDGLLDLAVVAEMPFLRVLDALPIVLRDGDLPWPEVHRARARRIHLRPGGAGASFIPALSSSAPGHVGASFSWSSWATDSPSTSNPALASSSLPGPQAPAWGPFASPILFHGDGEVLGPAPVTVEVLPRALRIIC